MMSWVTFVSGRFLKGRIRHFHFSPVVVMAIAGIAFGMVATLVSLSVIAGFQKAYREAILGFNAHIVLIRENEMEEEGKTVLEKLKSFGQIAAVTPFVFREGLAVLPDEVSGVVIKGVDPNTMREVYSLTYQPLENLGNLLRWNRGDLPPVLVGRDLRDRLEGDTIRILVPKGEESVSRTPRVNEYAQTFRVAGTFESGLHEFDSQFVLTSLSVMESLFRLKGRISGLELKLTDPEAAPFMARTIEQALGDGTQAISWDELNESLFTAMQMEKKLFVIVMLLIMLVASFNVMGVILMMILSRQTDVAILSAMGAPLSPLKRIFSLQGILLGLIGMGAGLGLSALFLGSLVRFRWFELDPEVYFISHLPVEWPLTLWLILGGAALLFCWGAAQLAAVAVVRKGRLVHTFR